MSRWLAGHISDDDLRAVVEREDAPGTEDLQLALEAGESRAELERLVRETLQDVVAA